MRNLVLLHIFCGVSDFSRVLQEVNLYLRKTSHRKTLRLSRSCRDQTWTLFSSKKHQDLLNIISLLKLPKMRQTTTTTSTRSVASVQRRLQSGHFLILRVTKLKRFGDTVADWQEWKLSSSQRADSASVVVPAPPDPRLITNARMPPLCRRCTDG